MRDAEKDVSRLDRRREKLEAELAEKAAAADHTELRDLGDALAVVVAELQAAEEIWLTLGEEAELAAD